MTEELKNILLKIDELEKLKRDSQNLINNYCTDKSIPLIERWKVWVKYRTKNDECYILESDDFKHPLLSYISQKINDSGDNDRGCEIDYETFINNLSFFDNNDYKNIPHLMRDVKINLLLNNKEYDIDNPSFVNKELNIILKEAIMEENFGSYKYDW